MHGTDLVRPDGRRDRREVPGRPSGFDHQEIPARHALEEPLDHRIGFVLEELADAIGRGR